jgi:Porin subfamily
MKMVKSLLLGSAAGLVAVTAGQAADLPVKAKPVEYVKVCSLYGAGFYYMPGTDLCIKIGGWVRAEATYGSNGNMTWGPFNANTNQRSTSNESFRARGYITADVRNQTEYGTVRGYIAVGLNTNDVGLQVASLVDSANRAFVQWAGMTAGLSQSFYDFYSVPAAQYRGGYLPASDTGDGGWWVWAYTAQFGGGFSGTISSEARRTTQIIDGNCANTGNTTTPTCGTITPGGYPAALTANGNSTTGGALFPGVGAYGGMQTPDIVGNLRVDQAWGGAQIMGALHQVNATYYGTTLAGAPSAASVGHPGNEWGWAAGVGIKINTPFITQGDWFQAQFNVTEGALRYLFNTPNTNWGMARGTDNGVFGGNEGYGVLSDCVYGGSSATAASIATQTGCNLTSAWGFNASYEHYWTPAWHTSLYGAWYQVKYNTQANAILCSDQGGGNGAGAGSAAVATGGCNNNWSNWGVGSRTQWDVTKTFYLGVEVLYSTLQSAQTFNGAIPATAGGAAFGGANVGTRVENQSNWAISLRAHRDFLP